MIGARKELRGVDVLITSSLGDYTVRAAQAGEVRIEDIRVGTSDGSRQTPGERAQRLQAVFVLQGSIHLRHHGDALRLDGSSWSIVDASECTLAVSAGTHALVVTLPDLRQASARTRVQALSCGVGGVLLNLARSTLDAATRLNEAMLAEIGNSLTELTRLALRDDWGQPSRLPVRTILCERVKTFVRRHLRQSNLSIAYIARHFRCTKRHLHNVFGETACSLNQYIWGLRLDRCARDLANADFADRSVTAIAYSWGFSNSSHFSRAFRQRFGVPPSVYRNSVLSGDGRGAALVCDHSRAA